jgi:2,4-diaminopentanoate dehydrogenase
MARIKRAPRIVIYGVGQYGQYIVRFAEQKGWKIVAAFNRAGKKIGQDIGRLAGLDRDLGIVVRDCETADYNNLDADIGVVTMTDRIAQNFPAYQRLMNAGMNVICHGGEAIYPVVTDPAMSAEIDRIAKENKVTFTGTGVWDMSRVWAGMLVAGPCTEIKSLFHRSVTNTEGFSKEIMLGTGTGMTVEEFEQKIAPAPGSMGGLYMIVPQLVLSALGYTITSCTERREPVVIDKPFFCKALDRELAAGLCAGWRCVIEAKSKEGVTATAHMEARVMFRDNDVEHMFWSVEGKPRSRITIERDDSSHMTISSLFNRIQDVIAAPPGIQLVTTFGPMKHTALE